MSAAQKAARRRRYPVAKVKGGWTEAEDQALKTCAHTLLLVDYGHGKVAVVAPLHRWIV